MSKLPPQQQNKEDKIYGVYLKSVLTKKVILSITDVGKNIKNNIEKKIMALYEGKCITEGFIRPNSTKIINYSSGLVNLDKVEFQVVFECMICNPVEGTIIKCISKNITKAGIHAEVNENGVTPLTIFIARDHHYNNKTFNSIKENTEIYVKVIGIRFELNDPYICVIGKLHNTETKRTRLKIMGGYDENDDNTTFLDSNKEVNEDEEDTEDEDEEEEDKEKDIDF